MKINGMKAVGRMPLIFITQYILVVRSFCIMMHNIFYILQELQEIPKNIASIFTVS